MLKCLVVIFCLVLVSTTAGAGMVAATWEYPDPPPDIQGFTIYMNMGQVWTGSLPDQRSCQFELDLTGEPVDFTIVAFDAINESAHSEVFPMDPPPPAPTSLNVLIP